tara:strand:+ start:1354 stop:2988 length:1635 start_codon:yes stop_codon:yes gene_type:complete
MTYIGTTPNYGTLHSQTITTANGSTATFTLDQYVADADSIIVTIGNVVQEPVTAYTASGNSITFTENVPNGDTIVIRYLGRQIDVPTSYTQSTRYKYVATNNQTTFSGADANSLTLSYTTGNIDCYLNGVHLDESDFTATNGTSVVLGSGATTSDELVIVAWKTVQISNALDKTAGGTVTGATTFNGVDVNGTELILDADGDTSITADTDDKIHFKVGGSDKATLDGTGTVSTVFHIGSSTPHSFHSSYNEAYLAVGKTLMMQSTDNSGVYVAEIGANWHNNGSRVRNNASGYVYRQDIDTYNGWNTFMNGTNNSAAAGTAVTWHNALALNLQSGQMVAETNLNSLAQYFRNTHSSSPYGAYFQFTNASPDNTDNYFIRCIDGGGTTRATIYSDGDLYNHDGTYTQISDERIKTNITDAKSQWDDLKAIRFVNYEKKDDVAVYGEGKKKELGVVAQELEKVCPSLVKEYDPDASQIRQTPEFGTLYEDGDTIPENKKVGDVKEVKSKVKGIKQSILYMKAVKALQEAMARIETLEAKVKTLEEA